VISSFKNRLHNLVSDEKFSEILTGSAWALGAQVLSTVLAMVTSIIIARLYGAEVIGVVAMITSFIMLMTIFTVLGTNTSILRMIPEHITKYSATSAFKVYRKTQTFVVLVSVITGGLLFFASNLIADKIFSKPHLSFLFALAALFIIFVSLTNLTTQAVRGLHLIRTFAFMQLLPSLSRLLILLVITLFFYHQYNPVYALFASFMVTALMGVLIIHCELKKKKRSEDAINDMPMKSILTISLPMLMTATMAFVIGQTGIIMLGIFRPEAEVGYYAIAVKLATLTTFVLQAINSMAAPRFSTLYHSGKIDDLLHVAKKSAKLIFWTTAPIALTLIVFGKLLLGLLFGQEYTVAYLALFFLIVGQFINSISGSTGLFMNMTGHEKVFRNIIAITLVINVALNLVLIPNFGIYGSAFAGMVSLSFWNIYTLIYIKLKFGRSIGHFPFTDLL
jgi:O-antigen/teichoic acid export membrane protein